MFGGLGNLTGFLKQAKEMQGRFQEMQQMLANSRYEADSGAGAVRATVTGKLELVDLRIDPATASSGDIELLEDLVKSAVCAAQRKAGEAVREEMQKMTGGLSLPGIEGLMGG